MKVIAVIPIKHHSSRVPHKNYRLLNGKPLYSYIIQTLTDCPSIDQIIVDTDSLVIIEGLVNLFPDVIIYERPDHLKGDNVSTNLLLHNVVSTLELDGDLYLHTHTTNPLVTINTIEACIDAYAQSNDHDSLFTVNKWHKRFYQADGTPLNHDPNNLIPTQDLVPWYEESSTLYIVPKETLSTYKRRIGIKPLLYPISQLESMDIDWEEDFETVEALMRHKKENGKVVLVTGSNGGIGSAISKKFRTEGWLVVGVDLKEPSYEQRLYLSDYLSLDLTNQETPDKIVNFIGKTYGRLDCIVNNAAVQVNKKVINTTYDEWSLTMDCNTRSAMFCVQKAHTLLKQSTGSVINISSIHAIHTSKGIAAYAASKGALAALTRAMALELIDDGIRVNAVLPGAIDTQMLKEGLERGHSGSINDLGNKHPIGRVGKPEEIAELVYFLSGPKCAFIIGQCIVADGGCSAKLASE